MIWGFRFIGRPFVKRFALCYRTVVSSVCPVLSVQLVYCGQTVRWIKIKLGIVVGLGTGPIVLDGDPAVPRPKKEAQQPLLFDPCLLWPNGRPTRLLLSTCCTSRSWLNQLIYQAVNQRSFCDC